MAEAARRLGRRPRKRTGSPCIPKLPRILRNPYPPIAQFSDDEIEAIHLTSLQILEEIGIKVLNREARSIYAKAGFKADAEAVVRFDRDGLLAAVGKAPALVELQTRNPARRVRLGENYVAFCTVGGTPNVSDMDLGRRPGTLEDFRNLMRLAQAYDVVHMLAPATEPLDIAVPLRHLHMTRAIVELTDKVPFIYSRGHQAVSQSLAIMRAANGLDEEGFQRAPCCYTVVNANSPLQLDDTMCKGIIDFARFGQLMILTPFTLAGAMAPITLPGALAQQNAEALAGIALSQLVRPGAPAAYGGFTSNVDMKSGAPAFGTPEYVKAAFASGQLARRYKLPFRSSNVNASNAPDAQSAYESQMSLWGALMGGCNILLHGAGWLEGGLTASFEKFIIDVEMLQMFESLFQPVAVDQENLAMEALREIKPGGHYFGTAHTLRHYTTAFYSPLLSDWRNFESWQEGGSPDATRRANAIWKKTLADFEAPPLDPARLEEVGALCRRFEAEGGADLDE
jgi:trimethylamine--corrinoid protein Co-methyltransferase